MSKIISARHTGDIVKELVVSANRYLPGDVFRGLETARQNEESETGSLILDILMENACAAAKGLPVCQDTGVPVVFLELSDGAVIEGNIEKEINRGIAEGTETGLLRSSVCDPLTRKNSGNNTPAVIHIEYARGSESRISVLPKGCGSENMSALFMLPPSAGLQGIVDAVTAQVKKAGPNPCPPGIVGVGIGGTMEKAAMLSKKALLRPLGRRNPRSDVAGLEDELETAVNAIGNGPQGLGGTVSCLGVAVEIFPCHIASLPVAVNIQCHAARRASATLRSGRWHVEETTFNRDLCAAKKRNSIVDARPLRLPLGHGDLSTLKAGDWVLLSGTVYTGRDQTHRFLVDLIEQGRELPVDLKGSLIYYTGPSPAPPGMVTGSAGPTTSYRMDAYTPAILDLGVKAVMGKGKRSPGVRASLKDHQAVYLATIGGAGAYLAERVISCETVAFPELGPEALFKMELKDFPAVVIVDCQGNDYYEKVLL